MTTLAQDLTYPLVGQTLSLLAIGAASNRRVRWRVVSRPIESAIPLYTATEPNYLTDGKLTPDADGIYGLEAVEEEFDGHIPHYSNDFVGSGTVGAVDHWTVKATTSYTAYIGRTMTAQVGYGADTCTLTVTAIGSATYTTGGILTSYYSEDLCPKLSDPSTDRIRVALGDASVLSVMSQLGGEGYLPPSDKISASQFTGSPYTLLTYLALSFDGHRAQAANAVHGAADAGNLLSSGAVSSVATAITLLNEARTDYALHRVLTGGGEHGAADNVNATTAGVASDYASCVVLYNDLATRFEAHRVRLAGGCHAGPGDGQPTSRLTDTYIFSYEPTTDLYTACNDFKAKYNNHLGSVTLAAAYHSAADGDNAAPFVPVYDSAAFVRTVNDMADVLGAHCTNIKWSDKSSASYHTQIDAGGDTSKIARASTMADAIRLLHYLCYVYLRHVDNANSTGWHGCVNAGAYYNAVTGLAALDVALLNALTNSTMGTDSSAIEDISRLVAYGGFTKA